MDTLKFIQVYHTHFLFKTRDVNFSKSKFPGEKRYKCEICGKGMHHNTNLCSSTFFIFTTISIFTAFTESSTRRKHMLVHNPNKQFKCDMCDKAFSRKINLNVHIKTHYRQQGLLAEGDVVQECPVCFKTITYNFKQHMRNHERGKAYACKLCDARFHQSNSLRAHMSKHTGKKEYCCTVCLKEFSMSSNLTKHMRIHTGEKRQVI